MQETTLTELGLNVLTKEQYENAKAEETLNNDALYFVPETEYDKGTVECYTKDLLWTNPNPTSSFEAQTISLDLLLYDEVFIIFSSNNTTSRYDIKTGIKDENTLIFSQEINSQRMCSREFQMTNSGVVFAGAISFTTYGSSASYNNNLLVPQKIYGIKKSTFDNLINLPPIADFIVEQGTSGIWTYRKWNSGIAECWGNTSENHTCNIGSSAPYYKIITRALPTNLFIETPTVEAAAGTSGGWQAQYSQYANTKDDIVACLISDSNNSRLYTFNYHAIGKWK